METPSITRRVTRSQNTVLSNNNKPFSNEPRKEEPKKVHSRPRKGDDLVDITNDSPIIGLATMKSFHGRTPFPVAKNRDGEKQTPGSGEALLRDQVKILLQKVEEQEEEAELSKNSFDQLPFLHLQQGLSISPLGILDPTPAITSQVFSRNDVSNLNASCEEDSKFNKENQISRSLLFDSPTQKSEISDSFIMVPSASELDSYFLMRDMD